MGGFAFRLEHQDGTPAEPRTFEAAVPNWGPGDTIHLARERALRVVAVRDDDADQGPALLVEDARPEAAPSGVVVDPTTLMLAAPADDEADPASVAQHRARPRRLRDHATPSHVL
jgi:hypothetical protein